MDRVPLIKQMTELGLWLLIKTSNKIKEPLLSKYHKLVFDCDHFIESHWSNRSIPPHFLNVSLGMWYQKLLSFKKDFK